MLPIALRPNEVGAVRGLQSSPLSHLQGRKNSATGAGAHTGGTGKAWAQYGHRLSQWGPGRSFPFSLFSDGL